MLNEEGNDLESCGPQLFADGEPSNEWGLEELDIYAQMQYQHILSGERLLSPAYWRLGHALVLAKEAFAHGKWSQHLKDLGIDKTRASKARAIYRTFDKPEDVAGLTVEEAYARRQGKEPAQSDRANDDVAQPEEDVQRLRRSVSSIGKRTEGVIDAAAFAAPAEAQILIPAVRKAIRQLQELLACLEQQAGPVPPEPTVNE